MPQRGPLGQGHSGTYKTSKQWFVGIKRAYISWAELCIDAALNSSSGGPQMPLFLPSIIPLFLIQRSVITIFAQITGIGIEIIKFSCAVRIAQA